MGLAVAGPVFGYAWSMGGNMLVNRAFEILAVNGKGRVLGGQTTFWAIGLVFSPTLTLAVGAMLEVAALFFAVRGLRAGQRALPIGGIVVALLGIFLMAAYAFFLTHGD